MLLVLQAFLLAGRAGTDPGKPGLGVSLRCAAFNAFYPALPERTAGGKVESDRAVAVVG